MTDPVKSEPEADAASRASAARTRYFVISLFRLSGVFILLFGVLIMLKHFDWVQGERAKWMGFIFACVGFVQTIIVPRMLLRAWATPRDR
jgi:protein-S-isoprenylcysteine O-methyltransferase Ste14